MLRWMKCISFCLKHSNYVSFSSLFIAFLLCDPGLTYVPPINKRTIPKIFLYVCNLGLLCLAIWLYSEPYTYVIRWTCACFTKMNRLIFNDLFWNLSWQWTSWLCRNILVIICNENSKCHICLRWLHSGSVSDIAR